MKLKSPLLLLTLAALLLAAPASASAAASVKRFPTGAKVGSISATAKRTSKAVTVRVKLSLKAPKGNWRAGVLVSMVCGDRSLSGSYTIVKKRRVVASVLVSRTTVGAVTWARGQTALRTK